MRIGSMMPAAATGEIASAINGTPSIEIAPPKPPLASPTSTTAGTAAR
jgi:hypothetical protein